jgi:4-hydroxy-tetrahydrodipicolinate synthase
MSSRRIDWSGEFVVCVTPFAEDGAFDESAVRALVELLITEGAQGLVLAGSTGEWFSMSLDEKVSLFGIGAQQARGRAVVLGGASAICTADAVQLAIAAREARLDGLLLLPPPYVLPTEAELFAFIAAVDAVGLPIMLYNNPLRTGVNLDARLIAKLLRFPRIVALKESAKDLQQIAATLRAHADTLAIFSGMETYAVPAIARGARGIVAMAPNVIGMRAMALHPAAVRGDWQELGRIQALVDALYDRMYGWSYNPYVVIKEAMRLLGRPGGHPRPPLLPIAAADRVVLRDTLVSIGVLSGDGSVLAAAGG